MPEAHVIRIDIHPNKGNFDFAVVTKEFPKSPAWIRPAKESWFAMACAADSTKRGLKIKYGKFVDGPGADNYYADVISVEFA